MLRMQSIIVCTVLGLVVASGTTFSQEKQQSLPKPDDKPGAVGKPIKVFILMGQSNMVGMGDNRNAETYLETGLRLGWAMTDLLKK